MYAITELFETDWSGFHDAVMEAQCLQAPLTREYLQEVFATLPDRIRLLALMWGLSDTVFRDEVFLYLRSKINPPA